MTDDKNYNPNQKAVALQYDPGMVAPQVVAKGQGYVAGKLLEKAAVSNIPVHKDVQLAEALSQIDLGEHIPPELYEVVAQLLVFIANLDAEGRKPEKTSGGRDGE